MKQSGHIFNPKNDTLQGRIEEYYSVQKKYMNLEASLKLADDPEWSNTLGDAKTLEEAHQTMVNSLVEATQAISIEDIDKAKEQGLMSDDEAYELAKEKLDLQTGRGKSIAQESKQSRGLSR